MSDRTDARYEPTTQRQQRAVARGQVARSPELATSLTWLAGITLLITLGPALWLDLEKMAFACWDSFPLNSDPETEIATGLDNSSRVFWKSGLPILGGLAAIAILAHLLQTGFRWFPALGVPDASRLSPVKNFARLTSGQQWLRVGAGWLKLTLLSVTALWILNVEWPHHALDDAGDLKHQWQEWTGWLGSVAQRLCGAAVIIGLADYGIQRWLTQGSLQMTDEEVREERRSTEAPSEVTERRRMHRVR